MKQCLNFPGLFSHLSSQGGEDCDLWFGPDDAFWGSQMCFLHYRIPVNVCRSQVFSSPSITVVASVGGAQLYCGESVLGGEGRSCEEAWPG